MIIIGLPLFDDVLWTPPVCGAEWNPCRSPFFFESSSWHVKINAKIGGTHTVRPRRIPLVDSVKKTGSRLLLWRHRSWRYNAWGSQLRSSRTWRIVVSVSSYPLGLIYPIKMVIFQSYVSWLEGIFRANPKLGVTEPEGFCEIFGRRMIQRSEYGV